MSSASSPTSAAGISVNGAMARALCSHARRAYRGRRGRLRLRMRLRGPRPRLFQKELPGTAVELQSTTPEAFAIAAIANVGVPRGISELEPEITAIQQLRQ